MLLSVKTVLGTGGVLLLLAAAVALIIYRMIKNKRQGKSTCSCGCSGCAMRDICHKGGAVSNSSAPYPTIGKAE